MHLRSLSGVCLVLFVVTGVSASGCGSSDSKKRAPGYMAGGEAGAGEGGSGGRGASGGDAGAGDGTAGDAGAGTTLGGQGDGGMVSAAAGAADGGAGGEAAVVPFHGLYVGEDGADTATGTAGDPFETLAHAASVAQAGDTIVFLDGSYSVGTLAVIPAGVDLMAENAGAVTLTGLNGDLLSLSGDTRITGLKFQSYSRVAYFGAGAEASGTLTITDSTLTNCQTSCLDLTGSASALVSAEVDAVVGNGGNAFALLSDTTTLSMTGGVLQNYGAAGVIRATGESTVLLTDLKVLDGTGEALILNQDAVGTLDGVTIATLGDILIDQQGQSELTIRNSDLSIKPAAVTAYYCITPNMNGVGSLLVEDSHLHGCGTAIRGSVPETLTLTRVEISDQSLGAMDMNAGYVSVGGTIRITDCNFHDFGYMAVRIGNSSNLNDIKVRGTTFSNPATAMWDCVWLDGSNASTIDLGTVDDPGGNTFLNGNVNQTALRLMFQAVSISAVGNTWIANQQGADAQGKYSAPGGSGSKLEISAPVATGRNYVIPYGGTLLLAENP